MKSKLELMAAEILPLKPSKVVDIRYAQEPNKFLSGLKVYGV